MQHVGGSWGATVDGSTVVKIQAPHDFQIFVNTTFCFICHHDNLWPPDSTPCFEATWANGWGVKIIHSHSTFIHTLCPSHTVLPQYTKRQIVEIDRNSYLNSRQVRSSILGLNSRIDFVRRHAPRLVKFMFYLGYTTLLNVNTSYGIVVHTHRQV